MAKKKKHGKKTVPKNLTVRVPEPEEDLVEFFQMEVENSMRKGVFRKHAVLAASVAIDSMLSLIADGEFEEPDDLGFRLVLLSKFVDMAYGLDYVCSLSYNTFGHFPAWVSMAHNIGFEIDSNRADSAFELMPESTKEDLLLLEQYILSKKGISLVQFFTPEIDDANICFTNLEDNGEKTDEHNKRDIRNNLVDAFAFTDAYISFIYFDENGVDQENRFKTESGRISCIPVDEFSDTDEFFDDESDDDDAYGDMADDADPIPALAPLVFSGTEFELDREALNRAMEEKGYIAL